MTHIPTLKEREEALARQQSDRERLGEKQKNIGRQITLQQKKLDNLSKVFQNDKSTIHEINAARVQFYGKEGKAGVYGTLEDLKRRRDELPADIDKADAKIIELNDKIRFKKQGRQPVSPIDSS